MSQLSVALPRPKFSSPWLRVLGRYVGMILLALFFFGLILVLSGKDPIQSYRDIF